MNSAYDEAGDFYLNFVSEGLADPLSMFHLSMGTMLDMSGDVRGKAICDVACGEGHLSRALAERGASVTAIDLSENLLEHARQRSAELSIRYLRDDAQTLAALPASGFDIAVCNLALMDIPGFEQVFESAWRVLRPAGLLVISILHPCFETPFCVPESHIQLDAAGDFEAFVVRRYAQEGFWKSGGTGMRGRFGAHHRTLSSYLNGLIQTGFEIEQIAEPRLPAGDYAVLGHQINSRVGQLLALAARKRRALA